MRISDWSSDVCSSDLLSDLDRFDPIFLARPPRRPCAAGRLAQPVGQGLLKVPFARCGAGVARHVSAVTSPRQGPFHSLGCGDVLTLRKPVNKRQHFAHPPDSLCTCETALTPYVTVLPPANTHRTP